MITLRSELVSNNPSSSVAFGDKLGPHNAVAQNHSKVATEPQQGHVQMAPGKFGIQALHVAKCLGLCLALLPPVTSLCSHCLGGASLHRTRSTRPWLNRNYQHNTLAGHTYSRDLSDGSGRHLTSLSSTCHNNTTHRDHLCSHTHTTRHVFCMQLLSHFAQTIHRWWDLPAQECRLCP